MIPYGWNFRTRIVPTDEFLTVQPTWSYFTQPTQGTSNTAVPVTSQAPDVQFNLKGGFYSGYQHIMLSVPSSGYTIRYTLDGSEPTTSSTVFTNEIVLTKTTVVKARAYADGYGSRKYRHPNLFHQRAQIYDSHGLPVDE